MCETLKMDAEAPKGAATSRPYRGDEAAFVIYSPEQQRAREAERKAKEEAEKAEVCVCVLCAVLGDVCPCHGVCV